MIGGATNESFTHCFFETFDSCDSFTDLECNYAGDILDELTNVFSPQECEEICKDNKVLYIKQYQIRIIFCLFRQTATTGCLNLFIIVIIHASSLIPRYGKNRII